MTTVMTLSLVAPLAVLLVVILGLRWMLPHDHRRTPADSSAAAEPTRAKTTSQPATRAGERPVERRVAERRVA